MIDQQLLNSRDGAGGWSLGIIKQCGFYSIRHGLSELIQMGEAFA